MRIRVIADYKHCSKIHTIRTLYQQIDLKKKVFILSVRKHFNL